MDTQLTGKKIILGVSAGIAAYKACTLCRLLVKAGADVYVVMTKDALNFVGKATFEALSGHKVSVDIFEDQKDISHISLSTGADLMMIAPATANTIAKITAGMADNMLTAVTLAVTCPVVVAPAMNSNMYQNIATQENIATLKRRGIYVITPDDGPLACGISGPGRMKEPEELFSDIVSILSNRIGYTREQSDLLPPPVKPLELTRTRLLPKAYGAGLKVLITAGPTEEPIDPVRFISNCSSGKMGYALAEAALAYGAEVILVSGPVTLTCSKDITLIKVKSASQMLQAVEDYVKEVDIVIGCAAVADYRVENYSPVKIKKEESNDTITLKLVKNPDILATVGLLENNRPFTVGFAAETNNTEENAKSKLVRKNLDLIVLNDVSKKDIGFNSDDNEVTIFDKDGKIAHLEKQPKHVIAQSVMELIFKYQKNTK